MAYARNLNVCCQNGSCSKTATKEVLTNRNASVGKFCTKCAALKVKEFQRYEEGERTKQGEN